MRRIVALVFLFGASSAGAAPINGELPVPGGPGSTNQTQNSPTEPVATATAQKPAEPSADQVKQAKDDLRLGRLLLKKKDFLNARISLRAAYAVIPDAALLLDLVQCDRGLSANAEALQLLLGAQASGVPKLGPKDEKAVAKQVLELTALTARLTLTLPVAGVALLIDGKPTEVPAAGVPLVLEPGVHALHLEKTDFEAYDKEVTAVAGQQEALSVELQPWVSTGHVRVLEKKGQPLELSIDGKPVGQAPWEGDLPPGTHVVEGRSARLGAAANVELTRRAVLEVSLDAVAHSEHVLVEVPSVKATATLDGQPVALPYDGYLALGKHTLAVTAPGFVPESRNLVVEANKPLKEVVQLAAEKAITKEPPPSESGVKIGALLGIISVPRPVNVELSVKPIPLLGIGIGYSMLPELTVSKAKFSMNAFNGVVRLFPFQGAFYLGAGLSYQTLRLQAQDDVAGQTIVASVKHSGILVTPQLGWLWMWDSGFALGINLGVQLPVTGTPKVNVRNEDASGTQTQEEIDAQDKLIDKVKSGARYLGKLPLPAVDLIKLGFFF